MEITEVRIKLMEESEDRLRAFCSITIDQCFVVRDLKIIEGTHGPFVAMPSRKMSARCGRCGNKNHLRSQYCNQCGARLKGIQDLRDVEGGNPNKLYADIAHPINQTCRDLIQSSVIGEYLLELERAKEPGYRSRYDEEYSEANAPNVPSNVTAPDLKEQATEQLLEQASDGNAPSAPQDLPTDAPIPGSVRRPHMLDSPQSADRKSTRQRDDFGDGVF